MRLVPRFLLFALLLVCLPMAAMTILSWRGIDREVAAQTTRTLESESAVLGAWVRERVADDGNFSRLVNFGEAAGELEALGTRLTLVDATGQVIADSAKDPVGMQNHLDRPEIAAARRDGIGRATRLSATLGLEMSYVARRVDGADGSVLGFVRAAVPREMLVANSSNLRSWLLQAGLVSLVLATLVAWWFGAGIVRRLHLLEAEAKALARGVRMDVEPTSEGDEVGDVGRAVHALAGHFERQVGALATERHRLAATLGAMVEGVVAIDAEERILLSNRSAGRILGFDADAAPGQHVWEVVRLARVPQALRQAREERRSIEETVTLARGGPIRALRIHATPILDRGAPSEPAQGAVIVVHDVTELRRLERVRRDFVANASHELKTPVAAIRGLVETILDDSEMPAEVRRGFLERVRVQTTRLQGLVEEMLALSRFEAEEGRDPESTIDARAPALEAFDSLAPLAAEKAIGFVKKIAEQPMWVRAHAEAIRRIAANLLDNAIKYVPNRGHVWLEIVPDGDDRLLIAVEDDGPGIPTQHRDRVFERFYRVDGGRSRSAGGSGLGLAIVKHLASSLHGEVRLEQGRSGKGCRFEARIPRVASAT